MSDSLQDSSSRVDTGNSSDLIFDWASERRRTSLTVLFAALTLGLVFFVSITMRVKRTEIRSASTHTDRVLILQPSSPGVVSILQRAADVSVLALGRREVKQDEPQMAEHMPVFQPGFKDYAYELKGFPMVPPEQRAPAWMRPSQPPLPSRPELASLPERDVPRTSSEYHLVIKPGPSLESRWVRQSLSQGDITNLNLTGITFRTAVGESGRVVVSLPMNQTSAQTRTVERLRVAISHMRFKPAPGSGIVWGDLSFTWEVPGSKS